jgi:hypothetical protein
VPNGATMTNAQPLPWLPAGLVLIGAVVLVARPPGTAVPLPGKAVVGGALALAGTLPAGGGSGAVVAVGAGAGTDDT